MRRMNPAAGYWLVKTEPGEYAFEDLCREKRTVWDGVKNALALQHLRAMKRGDGVLIYHSGKPKAVVGLAQVVRGAYPDPEIDDPKRVVVDLEAGAPLPEPVPLQAIKQRPAFKEFALVRISRLSVMPVPEKLWTQILRMGKMKA